MRPITAKLTARRQARFDKKIADAKRGVERDALSYWPPAGFARWLTGPRPREYMAELRREALAHP